MSFHACRQGASNLATGMPLPVDQVGISRTNGVVYYQNQPFTGTLFAMHAGTADTAATEQYLNGREHSTWIKYHPGHQMRELRYYDQGKKTGYLRSWWPNGKPQFEYFFENDEYEGRCREWNEAGMLVREMNYSRGHEAGWQRWWYDNGKIKSNYSMKDGRRFGLLGTKNCINVSDSIFKK